ncbi:MAG: hypothetical protein JST42_30680 [Bacteroidetes bacterium]|nr:hypothetical protein [Bacteroidota bacterium]
MQNLERQVRSLKIYAAILTILVLGLAAITLTLLDRSNNFKEITAERINIIEKDGTLRMAISNHERQDPGSFNGKKIPKRDRAAGIIFFNDDGDECGGLTANGNKQGADMTYSVDQYKTDQIMQLNYSQDPGSSNTPGRAYGLKLWDRDDRYPISYLMDYTDSLKKLNDTAAYNHGINQLRAEGALSRERLFVGKTRDGEYGLFLRDTAGRPRLKICIDNQNHPLIESLDVNGRPTH